MAGDEMAGQGMSDSFSSGNPMTSAQQMMRPVLPKRFYKEAAFAPVEGGFALTLDGRQARTPARSPLIAPHEAVAAAMAAEWQAQVEVVDPSRMPVTRLANSILDGIAVNLEAVIDEMVSYAGSDLLCYRAHAPEELVDRQAKAWDPPLTVLRENHGIALLCAEGVMSVAQDAAALARFRALIPADPWRVGALHVVTTLTGSAVLALMLAQQAMTPEAIWDAAHVDEDFQNEKWGVDEEAERRRAHRLDEFTAATQILMALKTGQ